MFSRKFSLTKILAIFFIFTPISVALGDEQKIACDYDVKLELGKKTFGITDHVNGNIIVTNIGKDECKILQDVQPEGWLYRLEIKRVDGFPVYSSDILKNEMTATKIRNIRTLKSGDSLRIDFEIGRLFPMGEYVIDGKFSTQPLAGWKIQGLLVGTWQTNTVAFSVLNPNP